MKKLYSFILIFVLILSLCGCNFVYLQNEIPVPDGSSFAVHYIDVGQADSALVICDDKAMLIDGGNVDDSQLIVSYLKKMDIDFLDYVVCTHAHEDHVGGLSGALSYADAGRVFAPESESDSKAYRNFKKKVAAQGIDIEHPIDGDEFSLGSSTVQILGPIYEDEDDLNNTSIVLKVIYGETSFLFTGDAERDEEHDIIDEGYDLSATVLKVGHHGSDTSSSYRFLREVMPEYAIISVEKDNSYGHPHDEPLSRLKDVGAEIYRTDECGDIIAESDGITVKIYTEKGA
ncbi:MAG: MBL fold metallo-hydrolase [Clostridia bacterium]|nr:MBL fold metallo-hydrolase [Clostridia bacterium]